jgi:hypothetical protein
MNNGDCVTEDDFTFICQQQWQNLEQTIDPQLRFCHECQKYVHFITDLLDFNKYGANLPCVAVKIEPKDNALEMTIVGGIGSSYLSRFRGITFRFDFGSIAALSKSQLDTIHWCRDLGANISRKPKNRIELTITLSIPEAFDRLVNVLEREGIEYSIY